MAKIILYHGSSHIVSNPICAFGRDNLDFGKGFYLTDMRNQAIDWARRVVGFENGRSPILNVYSFDKDNYMKSGRTIIFKEYNEEWLQFIVDSRQDRAPWVNYDYVEGGVANDRVIDTVNLYIAGLMDIETALGRLSMHKPNNQICLLNQSLTDKYLIFDGYEEL